MLTPAHARQPWGGPCDDAGHAWPSGEFTALPPTAEGRSGTHSRESVPRTPRCRWLESGKLPARRAGLGRFRTGRNLRHQKVHHVPSQRPLMRLSLWECPRPRRHRPDPRFPPAAYNLTPPACSAPLGLARPPGQAYSKSRASQSRACVKQPRRRWFPVPHRQEPSSKPACPDAQERPHGGPAGLGRGGCHPAVSLPDAGLTPHPDWPRCAGRVRIRPQRLMKAGKGMHGHESRLHVQAGSSSSRRCGVRSLSR